MEILRLVLHLLIFVTLLVALGHCLLNVACFEGLIPANPPANPELVSVLVPARNEAHNIEKCVRSLLRQDWPNLELIVLDDRSEDETAEILRRIEDPRLRVISGAELPTGWVGKNWACHQLSAAARGEWLFFTDADTEHGGGVVTAAIAKAIESRADLLSAWPRLITVSLGEKLIIPIILFFGMVGYPHALVTFLQRNPRVAARVPRSILRSLGAANGQFLLFRRSSYDRIGGHEALRDHLVEDIAFGRAVASRMGEGMRLINCESLQFSTCRMYRSFSETWEGFTKNSRAAFEGNLLGFFFFGGWAFVLFVFPFIALLLPGSPKLLVLGEIGIIYTIRVILIVRFQSTRLGAVLHPIGVLLSIAIGVNSWFRSTRGGVSWKGRRYTLTQSDTRG